MLRWFAQNAPIRTKMTIVTCVATLLACAPVAVGLFATDGRPDMGGPFQTGVACVALMLAFMLVARHAVCASYVATVIRMESLAAGDVETPIAFHHQRDCVGRMARAMHAFREAAHARVTAEATAQQQRDQAESLRAESAAHEAAEASEQSAAVRQLAAGLEQLAAGNLLYRIDDHFPRKYEQLRNDFNEAIGKLQETLRQVSGNTASIYSGSSEIARAADDLSRRTEQQAASLEQTAAALDEITATVRKTAASAIQARDVVGKAKEDAEQSGRVVGQAVTAMSGIEESSQQVSQIIGVIDEIAFQTNLLALNAGVEAARAGDAGRGFAVVASEVRALAQRSADAAKEIKALISTSSKQVESGVELVGQTGKALDRIMVQVASLNGVVTDIAASAQEQAASLAEVNTAVNQMDQVTQQNAAMVEESTAASQTLSAETESLRKLIGHFQVGDEAAAARPAPRRQATRSSAAAPLRVVTGRGATARKLEPVADGEAWSEF